jgi:hypothetical protein
MIGAIFILIVLTVFATALWRAIYLDYLNDHGSSKQQEARRQLELSQHRLAVRRDADATRNAIDRELRRRRGQ